MWELGWDGARGGSGGETREEMARWRSDARSRDPPGRGMGARTFFGKGVIYQRFGCVEFGEQG
jgi:hypothetical protein